jgi:hypothetical protein
VYFEEETRGNNKVEEKKGCLADFKLKTLRHK